MNETHKKHPLISAALSFIFPGAGQLYNEDYFKGLILFAAAIAAIISILHSGFSLHSQIMIGDVFPGATHIIKIVVSALIYFGLWLYGMIDGAISAQRISTKLNHVEGNTMPPKSKEGLIGLGVFFIMIGLIGFLSQLGIGFEYVIKYGWPVALILLGIYFLVRNTGLFKGGQ